MPSRGWLALFHIEPGEGRLVGSLLAISFVLGASLVLLRTAGDTLFLVHFRAEDLPYAFFATLVFVPAAGVVYNRLHQRLGDTWMAGLGLGFLAADSGLLYLFLVVGDPRWPAALLRVFVEVANALAALTFWGPVASLLTLRQAKRLYPLIGTGELVAGILGGVAVTPLVRLASVEHLVLLSAGLGALAGVMLISVLRANRRPQEPEARAPDEREAKTGLLRTVVRDRYLLLIALSYVFYYVSYELLRYVNVVQIEARFQLDTAAMASFFGALAAVRTVLVLSVRTFASGRLMTRYGIGLGLKSLPVVQIGGALVLLVLALGEARAALLFWAVIVLGVIEEVMRTALNKPAVMLLYRPLTPHRRNLTQTVVETFVDPGATALVGVLILGLGAGLATATASMKVAGLTALMLIALIALLVVFVALHREYIKGVIDALGRGRPQRMRSPLEDRGLRPAARRAPVAANEAALPSLDDLLADGRTPVADATRAAWAVGRIGGADAGAILRKHLDHPVRKVRARIIAGLRVLAWREPDSGAPEIYKRIAAEMEEAIGLASAKADLAAAPGAGLVVAALDRELQRSRDLILSLLSLFDSAQPIRWARRHLAGSDPDKRAYALEVVEIMCPRRVREVFLPLLETDDPAEILRRLRPRTRPARMSAAARLRALSACDRSGATAWLAACARHAACELREGDPMKPTIEKVIVLKSTAFFSAIEDDILAAVATNLVEQTAVAGERIFEQGECDASLFIIVSGWLRVHEGATVLAHLGPREVVGDLVALVPDVRTVSVTAEVETQLLRMDHPTLMDLIDEHTEMAYGIIRFLVQRLRDGNASQSRIT